MRSPIDVARLALACLDLTSLNDADSEADIATLCRRADGPHGAVAAVCVWPRFVAQARRSLPAGIAVAAVANFPDGSADVERAVRETKQIVASGGDEVDVVLPYASLQRADEAAVSQLLRAVRGACTGRVLKVILETGVLVEPALIGRASELALAAGADFLKTSTGKTPVSATVAAAEILLACIAADASARGRAGFKASGGIRTVADAGPYLDLVERHLGTAALTARRFRIGASSLLGDIEAVLGGGDAAAQAAAPGTY